jgi:hypothetical protein
MPSCEVLEAVPALKTINMVFNTAAQNAESFQLVIAALRRGVSKVLLCLASLWAMLV